MPLNMSSDWLFNGCGFEMPNKADAAFTQIVSKIAQVSGTPQVIYEFFKSGFGSNSWSSSASWAESDLSSMMTQARPNAAGYISSFYSGIQDCRERKLPTPTDDNLNKILMEHSVPLKIEGDTLVSMEGDIEFLPEDAPLESLSTAFIKGPNPERGGFGLVFKVFRKTATGTYPYAMKVLDPHIFNPRPERAAPRFEREMEVLGRLHHRAIITLLEAGIGSDRKPYILMPYIEGKNLRKSLSGAEPRRVIRIFDEILNALDFTHANKVIHRDLSPDNVLVRESDDQPIILDFGCAFELDNVDMKLTTSGIGKSPYMPYEVLRDPTHKDTRQDIYACGVMLYEVIAQKLPRADKYEPLEPFYTQWHGVDDVIRAAMAPEHERIPNAKVFREKLSELLMFQ